MLNTSSDKETKRKLLQRLVPQCAKEVNRLQYNAAKQVIETKDGRVWIPNGLRSHVLNYYHHAPMKIHQSAKNMEQQMRPRYYWVGMHEDIVAYTATCDKCQRIKAGNLR